MVSNNFDFSVFKQIPGIIHHGRNVWKAECTAFGMDGRCFLFYGGKYWWIGSDYKNDRGWVSSREAYLETFPSSNWTCSSSDLTHVLIPHSLSSSCLDAGLVIETYNLDMLMVSRDGDSGEVTSPGYPNSYPNDEYQRVDIVVSEGSRIKLSLTMVDIEAAAFCEYDYVQALDTDGGEIRRWCGETYYPNDVRTTILCINDVVESWCALPKDVYSSGNKMSIIFKSDVSHNGKGFHANWIAVPLTSTSTTTTTITTTTTTTITTTTTPTTTSTSTTTTTTTKLTTTNVATDRET